MADGTALPMMIQRVFLIAYRGGTLCQGPSEEFCNLFRGFCAEPETSNT